MSVVTVLLCLLETGFIRFKFALSLELCRMDLAAD